MWNYFINGLAVIGLVAILGSLGVIGLAIAFFIEERRRTRSWHRSSSPPAQQMKQASLRDLRTHWSSVAQEER